MALSESDKQVFLAATNRRKENGVRLRRISLMADAGQVEAFNILWESFVERWGKRLAVDHLIKIMASVEATLRNMKDAD